MWWLLKLLFVGPPSKGVETSIRRKLEDLTEDVARWEQKQASLGGQLLTQTRRISRLEAELIDEDDPEPDEDLAFQRALEEKRRQRG